MFDSWTESQFKEWADKNGIPVPQGSNLQELRAFGRKKQSSLLASGTSAYGAATTSAGNAFAQVTDDLYLQGKQWYDWALNQAGMASEEAKSSLSSISVSAASSVSSLSKAAASASSSASKAASKTGGDYASAGKSAASSISSEASASAKSASLKARAKASTARAKASASSLKNEL